MALSKEYILSEIRRTAKENGGKPLGEARFESESGIKPYDWGRFWVKFGDAQQEAGYLPNQFQSAYADEILIEKLVNLTNKLGKFPGQRERIVARNSDNTFPSNSAFRRFGSTEEQLAKKVWEYCRDKEGCGEIVRICRSIIEKPSKREQLSYQESEEKIGEVYLFKSGKYYKIGRTNDTVRRGAEIRIQLPENLDLVHSIKTDDSSGIEAYWHKRFEAKRMNGEWFDLSPADIKSFKHWRRIV